MLTTKAWGVTQSFIGAKVETSAGQEDGVLVENAKVCVAKGNIVLAFYIES